MVLAGKIGLIAGIIISLISLIGGFSVMFLQYDDLARLLFMVVPIGFMLMFVGLSTVVLFAPREKSK